MKCLHCTNWSSPLEVRIHIKNPVQLHPGPDGSGPADRASMRVSPEPAQKFGSEPPLLCTQFTLRLSRTGTRTSAYLDGFGGLALHLVGHAGRLVHVRTQSVLIRAAPNRTERKRQGGKLTMNP